MVLPWVPATATTRRAVHHRPQPGRPRQDPQPPAPALEHLGVVVARRRGDDERVGVADVLGRVAEVARHAELAQAGQERRVVVVAAGDGETARRHDPGDGREGRSPDADEVHPAELLGGQQHVGDGHLHRAPTSRTMRASRSSASRGTSPDAAAPIAASRTGSVASGRHVAGHPRRGELLVLHQQRSPGVDHRTSVPHLLAVADRQRHEDAGQPDRGGLDDAVGAAAREHEVGGGVRQVHPVDERHHGVRHVAGLGGRLALRAHHVQHLHARAGQRRGRSGDRLVEPPRALRAAGHEQGRPVGVEVEEAAGLGAHRLAVEPRDHRAQRQPDVLGLRQRGVREADRDPTGDAGAGLVGQARHGVLLVQDDRYLAAAGGEVRRHRHVAAEADDHVGTGPVEHPRGVADRTAQPGRDLEQVDVRLAWERDGRDQLERVPGLGDDPGLQAACRAETGDLDVRVEAAQGVGRGQQG